MIFLYIKRIDINHTSSACKNLRKLFSVELRP
jgi:hypothetical protein